MTDSIYTESAKSLTVAETAKLMRKSLKEAFPGTKFSVRSSSYAGGASIDVYWTDGPTDAAVARLAKGFEGASFDGMIDLKSYHDTLVADADGGVELVSHGADYVFTHRQLGEVYARRLHAELVAFAAAQTECDETALAVAGPSDHRSEFLVFVEYAGGNKAVEGSLTKIVRAYAELRDSVTEAALALMAG
jgi:hypothetical protein